MARTAHIQKYYLFKKATIEAFFHLRRVYIETHPQTFFPIPILQKKKLTTDSELLNGVIPIRLR